MRGGLAAGQDAEDRTIAMPRVRGPGPAVGAPRAEGAVYGALARLPEIDHAFELSEQAEKSGEDQRAQRRHHPGPAGRYLVCGLCAQIGGDAGDQVGQGVGGIF